jgi:hypothetical protein
MQGHKMGEPLNAEELAKLKAAAGKRGPAK